MTFKGKEQNTICGDGLPLSPDEILTGFIRILIRTGQALPLLICTRHAPHPLADLRFLSIRLRIYVIDNPWTIEPMNS
jgi:hypothetical protein